MGRQILEQAVSTKDRADALEALSADQRKRLAGLARLMAPNTGETGEDLLQAAQLRWLESSVPVEGPDRTCEFLCGAISSIQSNIFRHQKLVRKVDGVRAFAASPDGQDPIELGVDPAASQEDTVFAQQLYDLCANDSEVQTLVMYDSERIGRAEIRAEMGWDDKKYDAVRKRKLRMIARWKIEGKLP